MLPIYDASGDTDAYHPSHFETCSEAVQIQGLSLSEPNNDEVYIHMNQIVEPSYALCEIPNKTYHDIAQSMGLIDSYGSPGMMGVVFCCTGNPVTRLHCWQ